MPHPFPMPLLAFLDDFRMMDADIAVERDGGAHAVAIEHFHQSEHPNAVTVVAHRPDRNIGNLAGPETAGTRLEREEFDIGNDPQSNVRAARPFETRAPHDRRIRKGTVGTGFHDVTRLRPEPTGSVPRPSAPLSARVTSRHSSRAGPARLDGPQRRTPPSGRRTGTARVHRRRHHEGGP